MEPAKNLATWEALRTLREGVKAEVVGGVLVTPPAPLPRHSSVQGKLRRFIGGAFDDDDGSGGPGGWWIFLEVDARLSPHDIVKPRLAGWRRERLASPWDVRPIDAFNRDRWLRVATGHRQAFGAGGRSDWIG